MSIQVITADLYESALYHTRDFKIESIEIVKENKKEIAVFTFTGNDIKKTQLDYFNGTAEVNLLDFRRSYMHLTSLIGTAKKEAKQAQREVQQ